MADASEGVRWVGALGGCAVRTPCARALGDALGHVSNGGRVARGEGRGERGDAVAPPTEFSWHALIPGQGPSPRILRRVR